MATITCKTCGGKGYLIRARQIGRGQFVRDDETCPTCHGDGHTPQPTPPAGALTVDGFTVMAPTFHTARQFDAAVGRAFADGLMVMATDHPDWFAVTNPTTGITYSANRTQCSCKAGQNGLPCKHVAAVIVELDVMPQPTAIPAVA